MVKLQVGHVAVVNFRRAVHQCETQLNTSSRHVGITWSLLGQFPCHNGHSSPVITAIALSICSKLLKLSKTNKF